MKNFTITFTGIERSFEVSQTAAVRNFEIRQGVGPAGAAGAAGPNSVTSSTTSNGTCDLWLDTLNVGIGTASGLRSVALGQSTASGNLSFAQGLSTASEDYAFASGDGSVASGYASFAVNNSTASGDLSFSTGGGTIASGDYSTAIGFSSEATAPFSVAIGRRAKAIYQGSSVETDSQDADVESLLTNEKTFRFANGYKFFGGSATFTAVIAPKEVKSANFTAANGGDYITVVTLTVTDPSPSEGTAFRVLVRNGTATVGGTAYSVAGTVIERVFHSGAWANYVQDTISSTATLTNKTISGASNTITNVPISTGISGLGTGVATFLETPTSANLAAAVTDETGSGSLVFGTSPTITTPTISRGSTGQVFIAQDNNNATVTMTTDASGRNFFAINGKSGAASQAGAYITATGFEEAWAYVNCLNNTSGNRVMRFGNLSSRFSIQRMNDANSSITATPFSLANNAPTNSFYMDASGNTGYGTSSPTAFVDINNNTLRVRTARTPASATATGNAGDICWDANYIYVCTATNTWKRTAISTW